MFFDTCIISSFTEVFEIIFYMLWDTYYTTTSLY